MLDAKDSNIAAASVLGGEGNSILMMIEVVVAERRFTRNEVRKRVCLRITIMIFFGVRERCMYALYVVYILQHRSLFGLATADILY